MSSEGHPLLDKNNPREGDSTDELKAIPAKPDAATPDATPGVLTVGTNPPPVKEEEEKEKEKEEERDDNDIDEHLRKKYQIPRDPTIDRKEFERIEQELAQPTETGSGGETKKTVGRFFWGLLGNVIFTPVVGSIATIIYNCYHLRKLYKKSPEVYEKSPLFKARVKSLVHGIYIAVASCVPASVLVGLMHQHPDLFRDMKDCFGLDNFSSLNGEYFPINDWINHLSEKYNMDDIDALTLVSFVAFFALVWMIRATGNYFSAKAILKDLDGVENNEEIEEIKETLQTVASICPNVTKVQFTFFGLAATEAPNLNMIVDEETSTSTPPTHTPTPLQNG